MDRKSYVKSAKKRGNKKRGKTKIFETRPKGRFISFLCQFFGALLTIGGGLMFAMLCFRGYWLGMGLTKDAFLFLALTAIGFALYLNGRKKKKFLSRFRFYKRFMEGRDSISFEELSGLTGRKVDFIREDIKKMLDAKLFLQGRLDKQERMLILTDEGYERYCEMEAARQQSPGTEETVTKREERKKTVSNIFRKADDIWKAADEKWNQVKESVSGSGSKDVVEEIDTSFDRRKTGEYETVDGGYKKGTEENRNYEYVQVTKDCSGEKDRNSVTKEDEFRELATEYLSFYEKSQKRIKAKPVQKIVTDFGVYTVRILAHDIEDGARKRFFTYYLPITKELLLTYEEMEREGIADTAGDLEDILNTIRYSFEAFADKLSEGRSMDVETDILALEAMLNR